jgi:hypothetical protein
MEVSVSSSLDVHPDASNTVSRTNMIKNKRNRWSFIAPCRIDGFSKAMQMILT